MANTNNAIVMTKGKLFNNINRIDERAVRFEIKDKGVCVVGFAKDKNAFMEHYNGLLKETTKWEVMKRLRGYQGADAVKLRNIVKELKPVTMTAALCDECNCALSKAVAAYAMNTYGMNLCRTHQKGKDRLPSPTTARASKVSAPINIPSNLVDARQSMDVKCSKCAGNGRIRMYNHIQGGICFRCTGSGTMTIKEGSAEWRAYEKHIQAQVIQPQPSDIVFTPTYVDTCVMCFMSGDEEEHQLYHSDIINHSVCLSCCMEAAMNLRQSGLAVQTLDDVIETNSSDSVTMESQETSAQGVTTPEQDSKATPKPARKRRAKGESVDKKPQSKRGSRQAGTGVKGTSAKAEGAQA